MEEEKQAAEAEEEAKNGASQAPSQIDKELEKTRGKRTELEKLRYTKQKLLERETELLKEQGIEEEEDTPVTVGMLKKLEQEKAQKTALQLAGEIEDEKERELTIHHLKNSILSSGNPQEDLKKARAIVNSVKNSQIIEELARKEHGKDHPSGSGSPKFEEDKFVPTAEEQAFMNPPFNMSEADIIKARKLAASKAK